MWIGIDDNNSHWTEAEVARLLPLVSPQRREQAMRFKHTSGQYCCLRAWQMLADQCTELNTEWQYNEFGKPFVPGAPWFSVSHCRNAIAVAIDHLPIGIDIETIRTVDTDLITRTMNSAEQALINASDEPARAFTRLWTQKEAILKAKGTGIQSFEELLRAIDSFEGQIQTIEKENYIYTIAYGKLHCLGA